jgi:TonB-dependent heme/hemoglobin receptor
MISPAVHAVSSRKQRTLAHCLALAFALPAGIVHAAEPESGPELVITATRSERQVFDTPHAVSVVSHREVSESNASKTPDILTGTEGVLIQKTNAGGGSPYIRGLIGKQVLIMVDGVRLNNSYYRFGPHQYLNTIDPGIIDRIEVVRGPSSVLYGSDALGGVINVITRRRTEFPVPGETAWFTQLHTETADRQWTARAQFEGNRGDFGWVGGINTKNFGDLRGGGDAGVQNPTGYKEFDGDIKLNYRPDSRQEWIFAHQTSSQNDVPKTSEVTLGSKLQFNYDPQLRSFSYLEYRARDAFGIFDGMKLNLSFNRQKEGENIIDRSAPFIETRELTDVRTSGMTGEFTNRIGSANTLVYGFDYYADSYDTGKKSLNSTTGLTTTVAPGTPNGATYTGFGLYAQDVIALGERAEIIAGTRYASFDAKGTLGANSLNFSGSKLTGSLHGLYRVAANWNLVGGIAQGYRAPNMEDFFGRVDFVSEIPNTQLQPEKSLNREAGVKYRSTQTSGEFILFDGDYDDLIVRTTVSPGVKQRQNLKRATIRGAEAGIRHAFTKQWSASGNLTYAWGEDNDSHQPLQRIPPLYGSVRARFDFSSSQWYEAYSNFARKQTRLSPEDLTDVRIPVGGTPGYATLNLRAGFRPSVNQEWLVSLENLGNLQYKTHGSGVYAPGLNLAVTWRSTFH